MKTKAEIQDILADRTDAKLWEYIYDSRGSQFDALTEAIDAVEKAFNGHNFKVAASIDWLHYCRGADGWGLYVDVSQDVQRLRHAPRRMRIDAVERFGKLWNAVLNALREETQQVRDAIASAHEIAAWIADQRVRLPVEDGATDASKP